MKIKLIDFGYKMGPERKHYNDTRADVYLINSISIAPHETKVIPCGFGIDLPDTKETATLYFKGTNGVGILLPIR